MKHTKGPWQILPEEFNRPYIRIRGTVPGGRYKIANVPAELFAGMNEKLMEREAEETRANAKRIVDCVNACEGMKDPAKEIEGMRHYIEQLKKELLLATTTSVRIDPNAQVPLRKSEPDVWVKCIPPRIVTSDELAKLLCP